MPLKGNRSIDLDNFLDKHPLNFLLFYGDYEVINTVYLDDGSPLVDLSLELFNQSPAQVVKFALPSGNEPASETNCHFYLNLEEENFFLDRVVNGWEVVQEQSNFYFLKKEASELQPKAANASTNKMVLNLKKFRADIKGGTRTLRTELTYGPLLRDRNNQPFKDRYDQYSSYGNTIFITNNRGGKKTLPLQVGFAAGNSVLNDGTATNSLELLIANKNWPSSNLPLSQDSEFVISFEMGNQEGAVATDTQIKAIGINSPFSNWPVQHVANSTEWTVKPKSGISQLASNEAIKLNITNLVTSHSSGSGYLYVRYKNIPNYPDGQFVVPVEKTPLLYRAAQVGIGTTTPAKQLHVVGDLVLGKNDANKKFIFHSRTGNTENNDFLQITSDNPQGNWVWEQGITLKRNGNVGIGTNTPSAKLHLKDGNAIVIGGNVGIGTDTPLAKLHVKDGDAIVSGKLAIGTTQSPTIHLAIGDGDTGINQQGDGKLAIYTNSSERVRVDQNGNVGIGTNAPSDKLHIEGNIRLTGNINGANQKLSIYSNSTAGNSNAWIELWGKTNNDSTRTGELSLTGKYIEFRYNSTDSTDGSVGMRLSSDGKVGIGTANPSAKLHVDGGDAIVSGKLAIGTTNPQIHLAIGDNDTGLHQKGDGKLAIYTDNVERVRIEKNGNVGIGTTDPKQKLHVQGRIRLSDVPVWDGGGGYDLTWVAHGYDGANENDSRWHCIAREGSSERYKQNIAPLEDDFQKLLSLQPKQYQMKEGYGDPNTWEFGYLAEDLDKIGLKSLVIYNQSGQPDGIQYKKMCIYLNEVVKSQQSSMERLEEKVNELNEKLMSSL